MLQWIILSNTFANLGSGATRCKTSVSLVRGADCHLPLVQESQRDAAQAPDAQAQDASSSTQPTKQPDSQTSAYAETQKAARERGTLERQLRGIAERISLAASRLQIEDAASSLTALEQLYQVGTWFTAAHNVCVVNDVVNA